MEELERREELNLLRYFCIFLTLPLKNYFILTTMIYKTFIHEKFQHHTFH